MILLLFTYCFIGFFIGVLSGLLGIGGGLISVPALSWLLTKQGVNYSLIMHMAVGTSLATIIFTSLASIHAFNRQGEIVWKLVKTLLPGIILGTVIGTLISRFLATHDLKILFGFFILIISFRLLFEKEKLVSHASSSLLQKDRSYYAIALTTGLSSGLLGVGGSVIIIPFLLHAGFTIRQASGTSITCALPIALVGVMSNIITSWNTPGLPPYSTGYIHWPAALGISIPSIFSVTLGAWLGIHLPQHLVRKIFAAFLIFVSVDMLFFP